VILQEQYCTSELFGDWKVPLIAVRVTSHPAQNLDKEQVKMIEGDLMYDCLLPRVEYFEELST